MRRSYGNRRINSKRADHDSIEVREDLGLKTGDRVSFIKGETGEYILKAKTGSIMDLKGVSSRTGEPVTIEEMNETIEKDGLAAEMLITDPAMIGLETNVLFVSSFRMIRLRPAKATR